MNYVSPVLMTCLFLAFAQMGIGGQYDALPLRGPLSSEPHFQTNLGRDGHRFSNAPINKYRLYDFYARQAEYHLAKKDFQTLLLPYPGLEGGRRGHWGNTNEKLSSAVLRRTQEPDYHRLLNRGPKGDQFVCITHSASQSVCLFQKSPPALTKVIVNAQLKAPVHAFSHKVDRFGFGMKLRGVDYLINNGAEWHSHSDKPAKVNNDGYHLHDGKVIFRRSVGKASILDYPTVSYQDKTAVYTRHLEWLDQAPALKFSLPVESPIFPNAKVAIQQKGDTWFATVKNETHQLTHRVKLSGKNNKITLSTRAGKIWISFPPLPKGTLIQMSSWITRASDQTTLIPEVQLENLSPYQHGGPRYFTQDVFVKGLINADPAASGSAYEIDDIPVPTKNPYGTPMTTCGLTFDKDGSAYVSTLVGDIWKITGLDETLKNVKWQRYASGLNSPLGLEIANGILHVFTQHQILQLFDHNNDGEADLIKPFTQQAFPSGRLHDLRRDAQGNFYCSHVKGIHRISPDGSSIKIISNRCRNPLGIGIRADGLALSDSSEGNKGNGTCSIFESFHLENKNSSAKHRKILYLPRGVDNSPGSRIFMNSSKFGPLSKSILGLSYGTGRIYQIMRDANNGTPQAALRLLPGEFSSGTARLATNPKDGQVYVIGLDGWGDFGVTEGCFNRLRFTGKESLTPVSWKTYQNGISVRFNIPVDPSSVTPQQLFLQQWNYTDSAHTYGSPEYSVKKPDQIGHDRLQISSIYFSDDKKEMFINAPDIRPAMCTQIFGSIKSSSGIGLKLDLYATINALPDPILKGTPSIPKKPRYLKVPYKDNNGNTYANITEFFDKRAGRDSIKRPVGPIVPYKKNELGYDWINTNIIHKQTCIACHGPGSKYDYSNYESLLKAIDLKHPQKSHLLGMTRSGSMPPYPMPTVAPDMQKALLEWIEMGAPKKAGVSQSPSITPPLTPTNFKTTGNWKFMNTGLIELKPRKGEKGWKRYGSYLWLKKQYGDFSCSFEYQHNKGGNSGFYFRVKELADPVKTGIEVQILDSHGKRGKLTAHDCGGVIFTQAPTKNMANPAKQWNKMKVVCKGHHLKVWLNGELIQDFQLNKTDLINRPLRGYIGFQDHGVPLKLRNITIKEH